MLKRRYYRLHRAMVAMIVPVSLCIALTATGCKPQHERDQERAARESQEAAANVVPKMEAQKATTGVGIKGASLEDVSDNSAGGIIAAPVKAYFRTQQRAVFEIQIPQMLNLYKATHGNAPKSHEEFMEAIEFNNIQLPALPEGMVYKYREDLGELWVEPIE